jgi:hypothetical protein
MPARSPGLACPRRPAVSLCGAEESRLGEPVTRSGSMALRGWTADRAGGTHLSQMLDSAVLATDRERGETP